MKTLTATEARKSLYRLIDEVAVTSEPIHISSKRSSAILIARDEGQETSIEDCVEELDW